MEEKEIKRILDKRILAYFPGQSPEEDAAADKVLSVAAAEIAKAVEEDKWDAVKTLDAVWRDIEDEHLAQAAEMRDIASAYKSNHDVFTTSHQAEACGCPLCNRLEKALSSAPEVLWAGEGSPVFADDGKLLAVILPQEESYDVPEPKLWHWSKEQLEKYGGPYVKVIVTKAVNQKRLTIESKPKKVDNEEGGEWDSDDLDELPIHDRDDYPYG